MSTFIMSIGVPRDYVVQSKGAHIDTSLLWDDLRNAQKRARKITTIHKVRSMHSLFSTALENAFMTIALQYYQEDERLPDGVISQTLDEEFIDLAAQMIDVVPDECADAFIGNTLIHAEDVAWHMEAFQEIATTLEISDNLTVASRLKFLDEARTQGYHVVDIMLDHLTIGAPTLAAYMSDMQQESVAIEGFSHLELMEILASDASAMEDTHADETVTDNRGMRALDVVKQDVAHVVKVLSRGGKGALNFSHVSPENIVRVLRNHVFSDHSIEELFTPIIYADGSCAEAFPLNVLMSQDSDRPVLCNWEGCPSLHVGMISERHTEKDALVSMYWFLNIEVSGLRLTAAEVDAFAYERSREIFLPKRESQKPFCMRFYLSGFEPALIGFLRALTEELIARREDSSLPSLEVIPMFYRGKGNSYEEGKPWN